MTCTQKLQKWHRSSTSDKAKAKAKAASHIRLKYFRNVRSARKDIHHKRKKIEVNISESVTDIDLSDWFTRYVSQISHKVENKLETINVNTSNHFLKCLTKHKINAGLKQHLEYRNAYHCEIIQEHDYAKHSVCYDETILTPRYKSNAQDIWHSKLGPCQPESDVPENTSKPNWSLFSTDKCKDLLSLLSQSDDEIISVKLPKYEKVDSIGGSNYVDVAQGSSEWFTNRI